MRRAWPSWGKRWRRRCSTRWWCWDRSGWCDGCGRGLEKSESRAEFSECGERKAAGLRRPPQKAAAKDQIQEKASGLRPELQVLGKEIGVGGLRGGWRGDHSKGAFNVFGYRWQTDFGAAGLVAKFHGEMVRA